MKQIKKLTLAFLMVPLFALASLSTGCGDNGFNTVVDAIDANDSLNTFAGLIVDSNFDDTLNGPGPFTVFAPTDAAFAALSDAQFDISFNDPANLLLNLRSYTIPQRLTFDDLVDIAASNTPEVQSLSGPGFELPVTFDGTDVFVGNGRIVESDIDADNGIVQVVNNFPILVD